MSRNSRNVQLADDLTQAGLPVEGSPFARGIIACTGTEFCKIAITETKSFRAMAGRRVGRSPARIRAASETACHRLPQQLRPALDRRSRSGRQEDQAGRASWWMRITSALAARWASTRPSRVRWAIAARRRRSGCHRAIARTVSADAGAWRKPAAVFCAAFDRRDSQHFWRASWLPGGSAIRLRAACRMESKDEQSQLQRSSPCSSSSAAAGVSSSAGAPSQSPRWTACLTSGAEVTVVSPRSRSA